MYNNSANLTSTEKEFLASQSLKLLIKDEWKNKEISREFLVDYLAKDEFIGVAVEMGLIKEILFKEFGMRVID